jgi:hypothetical protein
LELISNHTVFMSIFTKSIFCVTIREIKQIPTRKRSKYFLMNGFFSCLDEYQ